MYRRTTSTQKILALNKRIRAVQGGTSASKTISILLVLISAAQADKTSTITSIVSESFPHLKRGAIRDFLSIMKEHEYFDDDRWNKTDYTYTFETGSKIEFFSADQPGKVRGPRRDRLFINEANNVPLETFDQLEIRTKDYIFLDWNPTNEFWFYTDILGKRDDIDHLILTYKDNEALDPEIVKSIEQHQGNPTWWKVYGLGQLGEIEGKIYKDWQIIPEVPHEARLIAKGLDYGYTNDPSALVDIYYYNGGYIFDELAYTKGLTNRQIADIIIAGKTVPVIPDSAEPKSNDELRLYGITVINATKGKGSVAQGIQFVQAQRCSITQRSVNLIKEYRNYIWKTDAQGRVINEPEHQWSHGMDAIRYGMQIRSSVEVIPAYQQPAYERPGLLESPVATILETIPDGMVPHRAT